MSEFDALLEMSNDTDVDTAKKAIKESRNLELPQSEAIDLNVSDPDFSKTVNINKQNEELKAGLESDNTGLNALAVKNPVYSSLLRNNFKSHQNVAKALNKDKSMWEKISKPQSMFDLISEASGQKPATTEQIRKGFLGIPIIGDIGKGFGQSANLSMQSDAMDKAYRIISGGSLKDKMNNVTYSEADKKQAMEEFRQTIDLLAKRSLDYQVESIWQEIPKMVGMSAGQVVEWFKGVTGIYETPEGEISWKNDTRKFISVLAPLHRGELIQGIRQEEKSQNVEFSIDTYNDLANWGGGAMLIFDMVSLRAGSKIVSTPYFDVRNEFKKRVIKELVTEGAKRTAKGGAWEFSTEALQTVIENVVAGMATEYDKEGLTGKSILDGLQNAKDNWKEILHGGFVGLIGGGFYSGVGSAITLTGEYQKQMIDYKSQNAEITQGRIEDVINEAKSPDTDTESVAIIAKDNDETINEVYVDPNDIDTLFQTEEAQYEWETPQAMIKDLGLEQEYADAKAKGEKLGVPVDKFIEKIATSKIGQDLKPHTTLSRDEDSAFEVEQEQKNFDKIEKEFNKEFEEVRKKVTEKLAPAMQSRGVAEVESNIDLVTAIVNTMPTRTDLDIDAVIDELNLAPVQVGKELKQDGDKLNQEIQSDLQELKNIEDLKKEEKNIESNVYVSFSNGENKQFGSIEFAKMYAEKNNLNIKGGYIIPKGKDVIISKTQELNKKLNELGYNSEIQYLAPNRNNMWSGYINIDGNIVRISDHPTSHSSFNSFNFTDTDSIESMIDRIEKTLFQSAGDPKSENFKKWFKDSKVVDDKGEPLVVYHGSPNQFEVFDPEKMGASGTQFGRGHYFTDNKSLAEGYATGEQGTLYEVYMSLQSPIYIDGNKGNLGRLDMTLSKLGISVDQIVEIIKSNPNIFESVAWEGNIGNQEVNDARIKELAETYKNQLLDIFVGEVFSDNIKLGYETLTKITGYDGIIVDRTKFNDDTFYIIFQSNQAKSVDNLEPTDSDNIFKQTGTFSKLSETIRSANTDSDVLSVNRLNFPAWKNGGSAKVSVILKELFPAKANKLNQLGITEEEIKWSGIREELELMESVSDEKLTQQDVADLIEQKNVKVNPIPNKNNKLSFSRWLKEETGFSTIEEVVDYESYSIEEEVLGSYQYRGGQSIINLFENANVSTLAHETAHMYLDLMTRLESKTDNKQFLKDMETIRKYVGNDGGAWTRTQHEMFAETWTTYLKEGKSPTPALKDVFANFAKWLAKLYKKIRQIEVPINDEIRGVFDRMLATDEQIEEARSYKSIDQFKGEPLFDELEEHWEKAGNKAFKQLFDEAMKGERKKMRANWQEKKEELKEQAKKEVEESKLGKVLKSNINKDLFKAVYGNNKITTRHRAFVNNANAETIEAVAKKHGYEVAELIAELENSPTLKELIDNRAKELISEYTSPEINEAKIEKAVLNMQMELPLQTELNILNTKLGEKQLNVNQIIKANVIKEVSLNGIGAINSYRHILAMRSASNRSKKYLLENDFVRSKEEKIKEIYHFHMAMEHRKARDFITKARKYLGYFDFTDKGEAKTKFKNIEKAMAVGNEYNPAELLRKLRNFETVGLSLDTMSELEQFVADNEEYGLTIPDSFKKTKVETYGDLKDLYEFMKQIEHIGRTKHKVAEGQKLVDVFEKAKDMVEQAREDKPVYVKQANMEKVSMLQKGQSVFDNIIQGGFIKLNELMRAIDGKEDGMFYKEFYVKLRESEVKNNRMLSEYDNKIYNLFKKFKINMGESVVVTLSDGSKKEYTKETLISWVLNMGNEGNLERLINGNINEKVWTSEEDVNIVLDKLSKNEMDFVQGIWDILEELGDLSMENDYRITGVKVARVEAKPVVTRHGVYRGGYYPIKYDPSSVADEFKEITSMEGIDGMFKSASGAYTTKSHLKSRLGVTNKKKLFADMKVLDGHIRTVILDIAFRESLINIQKLRGTSLIKNKINHTVGKNGAKYIDNILIDLVDGKIGGTTSFASALNYAHSASSVAIFGVNMMTGISAGLGFIPSLAEVRPDLIVKGMVKGLIFDYKKMTEKSSYMRDRVHPDMIKNLPSVKNYDKSFSGGSSRIVAKHTEIMFMPIRIGDLIASTSVWWGAYYQFQKQNPNLDPDIQETEAIKYADSIVAETQGSNLMIDKSIAQRDKNIKYFLFAYTIFNAFANLAIKSTRRIVRGDAKKKAQGVATLFSAFMLSSVAEQAIRGKAPEDEDEWFKWAMAEMLRTFALSIPIFGGDMGEFLVKTMVDDDETDLSKFGGRFSGKLAPLFSMGADIIKSLNVMLKMNEEDLEIEDLSDYEQKLLTNVLVLFKIPVVQIKRSMDALNEAESGGELTDIIKKGLGYK